MRRYTRDAGMYKDYMTKLKDKFHDNLGHIFVDEILVLIDTEFEVKPPKAKKGEEEPSEEAIDKWKDKKRKAWKFELKKIPKLYADALDSSREYVLVVRKSLVDELNDAQVLAHLYREMRKINREYKIEKPDLNTFSDLAQLIGRPDWDAAYDIPNILEK